MIFNESITAIHVMLDGSGMGAGVALSDSWQMIKYDMNVRNSGIKIEAEAQRTFA